MATKEQIEYPVCDDCMLAAYDLCGNDKETQEELCREIGIRDCRSYLYHERGTRPKRNLRMSV